MSNSALINEIPQHVVAARPGFPGYFLLNSIDDTTPTACLSAQGAIRQVIHNNLDVVLKVVHNQESGTAATLLAETGFDASSGGEADACPFTPIAPGGYFERDVYEDEDLIVSTYLLPASAPTSGVVIVENTLRSA